LRLEAEDERLTALNHIVKRQLNVAQTEQYIEQRLAALQSAPPRKRPTFILKDVRLFLNSVDRGLRLVRDAGIHADYDRQETEHDILLTIRIPKGRPKLT
jgi:ParB family chromosome partitioning protein